MRFVPRAQATKVIEEQDPGELARIAWRAAVPDDVGVLLPERP